MVEFPQRNFHKNPLSRPKSWTPTSSLEAMEIMALIEIDGLYLWKMEIFHGKLLS